MIEELTNALKYFTGDCDLMLNISRIFRCFFQLLYKKCFEFNTFFFYYSKLTLHSDCCTILSDCVSCYKSFIKIMIKHDSKQVIFKII